MILLFARCRTAASGVHSRSMHLRPRCTAIVFVATVSAMPALGHALEQAVDNVAAFARMYGVVRYFGPSDAAATLDWDRFAVHGVQQVRASPDAPALQKTLHALFSPLTPRLEIGSRLPPAPARRDPDASLIAWRYLGPGRAGTSGLYTGKRTHRVARTSIDGFSTVMMSIPASDLRGRDIRLRALVRATPRESSGKAALWLRVDRPDRQMGFFDNMDDRPVRSGNWKEYGIEGPVAEDATNVAFGVMAFGDVEADFDRVDLAVHAADAQWTAIAIEDPGFEAAANSGSGWKRAGTSTNAVISRPTDGAPEGRQFLRIASPGTSAVSSSERRADDVLDTPPRSGAHVDVELGQGLKARIPLALTDAEASEDHRGQIAALRAALAGVPDAAADLGVDIRMADVVVAWNMFRHFYPYWGEVGVDWDARLRPQLELAAAATTRGAHRDVMRRLVAELQDGHGSVADVADKRARAALPVRLGMIEGQIAVTATAAPAHAPVGAVVTSIDGQPAAQRLAAVMPLQSGSAQWKQARALLEIATYPVGTRVELGLETGAGPRVASLQCERGTIAAETRPEPITDLGSGVWYVDLTRARVEDVSPRLDDLAAAAGVVFDVRGYPTDAGAQILPYLLDAPEQDRWMHVHRIVGPFGESAGWKSLGWDLEPQQPHIGGKVAFLTDGRAISYAESVLGYVADRNLGTIVGAATAGANGNVVQFDVPSRLRIGFTGMRVTGHDGRTPHHLVGVLPDIPMAPTLAGLRAGRDEVLDRAVALVRGQ